MTLDVGALTAPTNSVPAGADPGIESVANQLNDPMDLSSEKSNVSDWTSSSGSDSEGEESGSGSGSDSDNESDSGNSDSDSAPEQVSSRRQGPERVLPPPREGKKQLCRHFARSGQCNRGSMQFLA